MPFYSYQCAGCGTAFETLVRSDETPSCPSCGSDKLERVLSAPMVGGKTREALNGFRAQAAREGHLSNYSRSELKRR